MHLEVNPTLIIILDMDPNEPGPNPILNTMLRRADGRLNTLCTDSTECIAVDSMTLHYVSSKLDALHSEGTQLSELCD